MILEIIEEQPAETICDYCDDSQGPWYYHKEDINCYTCTICEDCAYKVIGDKLEDPDA